MCVNYELNRVYNENCAWTWPRRQKLEEDLEKLEHKLRIATTKKKAEKIVKIKGKMAKLEKQLNGPSEMDLVRTSTDSTNWMAVLTGWQY